MTPTFLVQPLSALLLLGTLGLPLAALAGDGHDHGDAPAAQAGPALPRFAATSDLFELVGVLDGKRLALYLDHAADNRPVKDAQLDLEFGGTKLAVQPHGEGEFEATLASEPGEGVVAVTATVVAGDASDLLAGSLDIHAKAHAERAATATPWKAYGAWGAALAALLALAGIAASRLHARRAGGAA